MGYVFQNIHGVMTVRDESTLNEPKQIRFIDPHYNEKFKIADGEQILVCFADGKRKAFFCQYLDDAHVLVGRNAYHICEFAERMERIGACVEPFPEKHIIWSDIHLDLKDWITDFEIRVAIDALAAYRRKQIDENIEHDSTNELLLRFLDLLEE